MAFFYQGTSEATITATRNGLEVLGHLDFELPDLVEQLLPLHDQLLLLVLQVHPLLLVDRRLALGLHIGLMLAGHVRLRLVCGGREK